MATASGPQTLGRYQIERVLGRGAMGVVYEALDPKLHRKVAIKTILISQLDEDTAKDFSMRFVREAHAVARLNHPNIVQVYDFGEESGVAYFVMEFIRGNELKSVLAANQTFDRNETVRIMCELLDALDFAHEAGVIHRDIKPANVMLDSQGRAKLADFGVARLTDAERTSAERTQAGTMVGTPAYMSPEQIQGLRVDRRTDIFSAGIILYQFLTGQKPFTGDGAWTVAKKIIQDNPPMPSSLNVAVTPEFDRVVAKALAKNPEERFSRARDFAAALKRAAEGKKAIEDDTAATVVVAPRTTAPQSAAPQTAASQSSGTHAQPSAHVSSTLRSGEMELEFWRSIKDSNDPSDFDFYLKEFPQGTYAALAGHRITRLRGTPGVDDSGTGTGTGRLERTTDGTRLHTAEGIRAEAEAASDEVDRRRVAANRTAKPAGGAAAVPRSAPEPESKKSSFLVPAVVVILAVGGAAAYWAMNRSPESRLATAPTVAPTPEADQKARSEAAEKARREAEGQAKLETELKAKGEAVEKARREAEAQTRLEADAKARRDTESRSKREADLKAQAAAELQTKRNADLKAQRDAEARGQREAEARAQREAEVKVQREAEARAQREAKARAQREAEAKAQREAEAKAQREAEAKAKVPPEPALWDSIKSSRSASDFQKYLSVYPNGKNADAARKRFAALESARLEEEKRAEAKKVAAENARLEDEKRAQAEAARNKDADKRKPAIIVPPTF
jgi:serine/threonine protein kinase